LACSTSKEIEFNSDSRRDDLRASLIGKGAGTQVVVVGEVFMMSGEWI